MKSGYVKRDGTSGSTDLNVTGRRSLPVWRGRANNRSTTLATTEYGPNVSTTYPIGHYIEDYDYLGDLGQTQGGDFFDLDEYNGRWCVTPEFPNGTYAYFATISSDGTPIYPYNTGKLYYGNSTGGLVTSITETVVTNFTGGGDAELKLNSPSKNNNTVTLTWSATEGGTYRVESSTNLITWTTNTTNISATLNTGAYTNSSPETYKSFRVARTSLATYDSVFGSSGILSVSPTNGNRGTTITITINLDPSSNPPPQQAPINSVTVGTITGSSNVHVSQTQVTSSIVIPAGAATGPQTVMVVFPGPPGNPTATVTNTLPNGFAIN
jgi:hypothetical protein